MPLPQAEHGHDQVEPFLWGLLPDNDRILKQWGERFHVSPRHPFQLLCHVGEECAGAVQLIRPDQLDAWRDHRVDHVRWLTPEEMDDRVATLLRDHSATRLAGDRGQFSLAGAQPKIALHYDPERKRWGVPEGSIPTTHILKPAADEFDGKAENEHFCLRLAGELGFAVPKSDVLRLAGTPCFVVRRYDRKITESGIVRIHQEDLCQALGHRPQTKYQNQGGPGAASIVALLRKHSSKSQEDVWRFFDALAFNWLIAGTDAHAKNYSVLIVGQQVRLAPFYDLISTLPYPKTVDPRRAKLAMMIGGRYLLRGNGGITGRSWEKCAVELELDPAEALARIQSLAERLPGAAVKVAGELGASGLTHPVIETLVKELPKWSVQCRNVLTEDV
jgi:serine/threonine-protein kinase HipA